MEFLEGGSLRDRIAGKPLPIPDLVNIALQVSEGFRPRMPRELFIVT